jgi:XTP/dITP diphosphohydrolase
MAQRRQKLLDALRNVPMDERIARFECVIVVADPNTLDCTSVTGVCSGHIAMQESGEGGFGYDPIFIPDGFERTFAEIDETTKNQISHRGRAIQQILPHLRLMATATNHESPND